MVSVKIRNNAILADIGKLSNKGATNEGIKR